MRIRSAKSSYHPTTMSVYSVSVVKTIGIFMVDADEKNSIHHVINAKMINIEDEKNWPFKINSFNFRMKPVYGSVK